MAAALVVLISAGCADDSPVPGVDVDEPHADADISGLASVSDLVVRGRVAAIERGVVVGDDDGLRNSLYTVEVNEALVGEAPGRVEVLLLTEVDGQEYMEGVALGARPTPGEGADGVWFLTRVDEQFGIDAYVLTSQGGLLVAEGEDTVVGGSERSPLRVEVDALGSLDAVAERVREVGAGG